MYEELKLLFSKNKSYSTRIKILKDSYPDLYNKVKHHSKKIQHLYDILHKDITDHTCYCGNPVTFNTFVLGYNKYCSHKCSVSDPNTVEKRRTTNMKRYGVINPSQHVEVKEKRKNTMKELYGVEYALQNKDLLKKSLSTYSSRSDAEKKQTVDKRKETNLQRYGYSNLWDSPEYMKKIEESNMKKWGVKWVQQNKDILSKRVEKQKENFLKKLNNRYKTLTILADTTSYSGINRYQGGSSYLWECKKCQTIFDDYITHTHDPVCLTCNPKEQAGSIGEQDVYAFVKSLGFDIISNDRTILKPRELDIYLPDLKIAIEYCGLYWHSDRKIIDYRYHQKKWQDCKDKGIRLITIFEDEWYNKQEICKNRLKYALGAGDKICYARQTSIKEIQLKEYKEFLDTHHIQGSVNSKIRLGAYFNNKLVSVMGFGNKRKALGSKSKENEYELLRFATLGNIPGIGSKLFKNFIRNYSPKEVISYCDLRWGTGSFYEQIGMDLEKVTVPNYWYSRDGLTKEYRYKFNKQKLVKQGYSSNKTEKQIMEEIGYYRIYDCGNKKFTYRPA